MNFTQFIFPHGEKRFVDIERGEDIEGLARELESAGWDFEVEVHPGTQMVNMDCCSDEEQLAMELVPNGPEVPSAVDRMVREAHSTWVRKGKPRGQPLAVDLGDCVEGDTL